MKLTVLMAAYNEERTIEAAVSDVLDVEGPFELELVVVDDGSSDETLRILSEFDDPRLIVLSHAESRGKGAAVLTAAGVATGTHLLVFDADLEYSARDIPSLVEPVLDGIAHVVYGARLPGFRTAFHSFRFKLGSDLTTVFANVVFDAGLSDMHTCLKLVPTELFRQLVLTEKGFGLDTELTGELLRRGIRPFEVPCSYRGRSAAAGKKISFWDGWECLKVVVRVRLRGQIEPTRPAPSLKPVAAYARLSGERQPSALAQAVGEVPVAPHAAPSLRRGAPRDAARAHPGRIITFSGGDEDHR